MNILNICRDDWANFAYDNMLSLRAAGLHCDAVKLNRHVMGYKYQCNISNLPAIIKLMANYEIIQFFHDDVVFFQNLIPGFANKKIIVYHTTTFYRTNSARVNAVMDQFAWKTVNAMPEFMAMGAKNSIYMVGGVNVDKLEPKFKLNGSPTTFCHYPSNPIVKGTEKIVDMIKKHFGDNKFLPAWFEYSTNIVDAYEQIERVKPNDVYIEMFTRLDAAGNKYGNFGITALECAALGKIIITNCLDVNVYEKYYGNICLAICNTEIDFVFKINQLLNCSPTEINFLQSAAREWVESKHGHTATGNYFTKTILNGKT
jgi:hypothetical protein